MQWKGDMNLVILACENQEKVHYAMPIRNMVYDGLSYMNQIKQWDSHQGKEQKLTSSEYLSHFRKEDKIHPVISLVWYYGVEKWDGNIDLHGMFKNTGVQKEYLQKYVPNYWINLICADNVEETEKFQTDLHQIFGMLKCRGNKEKLVAYINKEKEYFGQIDNETFYLIEELLQSKWIMKENVKIENGKETIDMCKALDDLYQEGIDVGVERGKLLGIEAFIEICIDENISKSRILQKLEEKFLLSKEEAVQNLENYSGK